MTQTKQRRKFSATFKTKVVLEALKERLKQLTWRIIGKTDIAVKS